MFKVKHTVLVCMKHTVVVCEMALTQYKFIFTSLPALLLCRLILACISFERFSLESKNFLEKCSPKSTLWLHPPHSQFLTFPLRLMSQPHDFNFPRLHATATW